MSKIKFLSFSFEYSVGSVIYRRENGKILFLLLHYVSGHWDFVKGHKEKDETDLETLKRETFEETGIKDLKTVKDFKKCSYYFYKAKGMEKNKRIESGSGVNIFKKVTYYLSETGEKTVRISKEHQGYTWIEYEKALKRITHKRPKRILKEAIERLQRAGM
ncbi:MAG: NUDIX domain-containing protein [Candidatus Moranbacteria bacterium]|nr:NUDIX domain-containing protein [Candidatus Moranbacteria bacterium]